MCLGVPARVVKLVGNGIALVDFGDGVLREVDVSVLEDVSVGDYVIVHAGIAIERLKEAEYLKMVKEFEEFLREIDEKAKELQKMLGVETP